MASHEWRRRPTKFFGEVWVPFAQIELRASTGVFRQVLLQVDSGATISLLRRSMGALLGLSPERGRRVELRSVGGAVTPVCIHEIETRFDAEVQLTVPFAIAEVEHVPNLLGRLAVFDALRIEFDPRLTETRISLP